jgi:hypothetical protein
MRLRIGHRCVQLNVGYGAAIVREMNPNEANRVLDIDTLSPFASRTLMATATDPGATKRGSYKIR